MAARIIDGRAAAREVRATCRRRVEALAQRGVVPGLAVVLIGDDPASAVYVGNKARACAETGVRSRTCRFPAGASPAEVLARIDELNSDPAIHGIIVQLPLPAHFDVRAVIEAIDPRKDVDGFHPANVGALTVGESLFPPCTPFGVEVLLERSGVRIEGQNAVVVGASNIVGKPMALMLLRREATVSICHIKTRDLAEYTRLADILVVAAGCPGLIKAEMVKAGATVIDVGINRLADGRLTGDVDFDAVKERAGLITPVPGGVGPMTVAMLIHNTLVAAERSLAGVKPAARAVAPL
ncbi:MAG TPA: bifunctional methylenetetrahydrofolate dehydrogenase/methenyltetrahydrofolate cyclohydrolase FolD [Pelomicrobium sp.]|nr:bifunctional methylenetetrahydrofolate dehydrogenase/methenyltetrahydrofolate cyclohydrolase FolD [Pelomicrobium sp.]